LPRRLASDERSNLANICVVQGSVNLIEHEKRRWMVATRKEELSVSMYSTWSSHNSRENDWDPDSRMRAILNDWTMDKMRRNFCNLRRDLGYLGTGIHLDSLYQVIRYIPLESHHRINENALKIEEGCFWRFQTQCKTGAARLIRMTSSPFKVFFRLTGRNRLQHTNLHSFNSTGKWNEHSVLVEKRHVSSIDETRSVDKGDGSSPHP
jgi:hypothetical protein